MYRYFLKQGHKIAGRTITTSKKATMCKHAGGLEVLIFGEKFPRNCCMVETVSRSFGQMMDGGS